MSRADGVLVVSLTYRWFDMIERGEKLEEYRRRKWETRLLTESGIKSLDVFCPKLAPGLGVVEWSSEIKSDFRPYHTLRAQRAYTGVWLERKIRRIRWGKPRPEWSGDTVTGPCFIIELEPIA